MLFRQRDNDVLDLPAGAERLNAHLEDRTAANFEELLWSIGAEADASSSGGNDGGRQGHESNECISLPRRSLKGGSGEATARAGQLCNAPPAGRVPSRP